MFKGSIPALVTPFRDGKVDEQAFERMVIRQIEAGTHAVVPCGTTGESATLSHDEHRRVVELCVEIVAGRIPVIAGAGSNSTREAIGLVEHAKAIGAHAALTVCPYYNRPSQLGLIAHFTGIADAVQLPLVIYNVPGRTVSDLEPETMGQLAKHPNVIAIKDATGDLGRVSWHQSICPEDFVLLSGDDMSAVGFNAMGGSGCISVTANIAPKACADMQNAMASGDYDTARKINGTLQRLHRSLFLEPSPAPTKFALAELGLCEPDVRRPILPIQSDLVKAEIRTAMKEAGVL
ncbi:4-hydroxy-tetrahydrodipicolinate synthase [Hirschia litorea]|uniref:4-hydroxy-tetrahydrodipicolinate synthase n=1 Tax=Hirschia litorea TaxID=1199156 RepID=A0ABW2IHN0_9PROT